MAQKNTNTDLTPHNGDSEFKPPEAYQQIVQTVLRKKPRRLKKDGTPYKTRRGWGPYRSVPNERAVAFNLQLDVQNLQQEVHNMSALRDILRGKTLLQRDTPEGSFVRVVKEFFHVFRQGVPLQESGRKRLADGRPLDQRAFLHSVMDRDVDAGSGLYGPDVMMEQMILYSTFLRFMCYQMHSFDIVRAEDSVVVTTQSTLRFQIRRATIEKVFPHIMNEEWLVAQLVGQQVEPNLTVAFYFNAAGKCCKYAVDVDFVSAFASIVKDPAVVDLLLGRALISDNCMFGLIEEQQTLQEKSAVPAAASFVQVLEDERDALAREISDLQCTERQGHHSASSSPSTCEPLTRDIQISCLRAVEEYYLAFSNGHQDVEPAAGLQREFLLHRFGSTTAYGNSMCAEYVEDRWRSFSNAFSVLGFHQKSVVSLEHDLQTNACIIHSSAGHSLRITPTTIANVFSHVACYPELCDALVGEVLTVPSQIYFAIDIESGCICSLEERMDFVTAMARIVADREQLQFVLSEAKLALDGVSCCNEVGSTCIKRSNWMPRDDQCMNYSPVADEHLSPAMLPECRTMRIADILS